MEIMRLFVEPLNNAEAKLLRVYKKANEVVAASNRAEDKIEAYTQVVDFCMDSKECKYEDNLKRNKILFWAFNNIADSFVQKKEYEEALAQYKKALGTATSTDDKIKVLSRTAQLYKMTGRNSDWLEVRHGIIDYLPDSFKRKAYVDLANEMGNDFASVKLLEKALDYVASEENTVFEKLQNTLDLCGRLSRIYEEKKDNVGLERINKLREKTWVLAAKEY